MRSLLLTAVFAAVLGIGCAQNSENTVLPADEQFEHAVEEFEKEHYRKAVSALQAFAFNYPQDPRLTEARWMVAQSYFGGEDWATAAQEFLNYQRDFPDDARASEALYMAGRSFEEMSLRPELDQRETMRAANMYQRVLTEYPQSEFAEETRERRQRLRNKLAEKIYLNAEFYFKAKAYDASEIYLTDLIEQHTDSDWLPAAYALLSQTFCLQGLEDRASQVFAVLEGSFPDSEAALEAEKELPDYCRKPEVTSGAAEVGGR